MKELTFDADLGIFGEHSLRVKYTYYPGTPAVMYLRNGDPGYPAESPEVVVYKVWMEGEDVTDHFSAWLEESETFLEQVADIHNEGDTRE